MLKLSIVINWEISLILTILSNRTKLAPLIEFNGKTGGPLEEELQNNLIYAKYQENSWVKNDNFKFWLFNIWFKYTNSQNKKCKKCLLIMDRSISLYWKFRINNEKKIIIYIF